MTVTVMYSQYDLQRVAALVGTQRAAQMGHSDKAVHMYMTGD